MEVHQGDQYLIPFAITVDGEAVTPDNVDGVRIQVDKTLHQWPEGELEYDSETEAWMFPLTEQESLVMLAGKCPAEVAVLRGQDIRKGDTFELNVKRSIIRKRWDGHGG